MRPPQKSFLVLPALVIIGVGAWYLWSDAPLRTSLPHIGDFPVLGVPKDISKECLRERELTMTAGGLMDTGNAPPSKNCPGHDPEYNNEVGVFQIGDHTLRIPREYLWLGRAKPSGRVTEMFFMFKYPGMSAGDSNVPDQSLNIEVAMHWVRLKCILGYEGRCVSSATGMYHIKLKKDANYRVVDESNMTYEENTEYKRFYAWNRLKDRLVSDKELYIIAGDLDEPRYWVSCSVHSPNPRCQSEFMLSDHVKVGYCFDGDLLDQHAIIRDKINSKINDFMENRDAAQH